jgi:hypothetical protein
MYNVFVYVSDAWFHATNLVNKNEREKILKTIFRISTCQSNEL